MSDTISRQAAIEAMRKAKDKSEAHRMLVQLPPAQLAQDLTKGCTDTISRAAVVDAIDGVDWYHQNQHGEMVHGANDDEHQAWYKADDIYKAIESAPPAQPSVSKTEIVGDVISRRAAIDALNVGAELLNRVLDDADIVGVERAKYEWGLGLIESYIYDMKELPSAQQWIPCSERLPGKGMRAVLLYSNEKISGGVYMGDRVWDVDYNDTDLSVYIIAWMSLPDPYKGEES